MKPMKRSDIIRFLILRTIGNFLVLFALFGVGATFGPTLYYELTFRINQWRGVSYTIAATPQTRVGTSSQAVANTQPDLLSSLLTSEKQKLLIPKDTQFSIVIPKIGANANITPNVDPGNETEYLEALKKGVAHAKGTVFPGMSGNIYLFAHSTDNFWNVGRYNALFYLIKDLVAGDEIALFFQGERYNYIVRQQQIVDAQDVSFLTESQSGENETLILQTCWPPGTTWKRLLVFAKPKEIALSNRFGGIAVHYHARDLL